MKNLFFGLFIFTFFSFTSVESINDQDCPQGFTSVKLTCTDAFCAKFPDTFSAQDRVNWVMRAEAGTCGPDKGAPSQTIEPAS